MYSLIVSACQGNESDTINTKKLVQELSSLNVPFTPVNGVYKGQKEQSFLIESLTYDAAYFLHYLITMRFDQESTLFIDSENNAVLKYCNGTTQDLGTWTQVNKNDATRQDAYTELNNTYFVAL